ncbi:MAG TPA: ACT domain-containing protein, partial [Leptolyngbyaceae cyanobacterium M65_K2018_010]|nr:ACT domain-containing protein [Leptolyngbyaceae cyanobacterium M65_K2018_010]
HRPAQPQPQPRPLEGLELAQPVDAVEFDTDQAKVALLRIPDRPGIAARLFGELANQALNVDLIIQSIHEGNTNDIAFTLVKGNLTRAEAVATAIAPALRSNPLDTTQAEVMVDTRMAKISIAGAGMIGRPGVAAKMFSTLAEAGINIQLISTSEVKVSCTIDVEDCDRAIAVLCEAFEVNSSPVPPGTGHPPGPERTAPVVRGAALDTKQAQVAIRQVPDQPGMAAKIFQLLANHGVSVDMIIQSQRCRLVQGQPTRDIAFTVALADARLAQALVEEAAAELGWGEVVVNAAIAKVSVVGIGMIDSPGVAARMFKALSEQGINLQMIATSEIKISCVVAESEGIKALQAVHRAFGLAGTKPVVVPA